VAETDPEQIRRGDNAPPDQAADGTTRPVTDEATGVEPEANAPFAHTVGADSATPKTRRQLRRAEREREAIASSRAVVAAPAATIEAEADAEAGDAAAAAEGQSVTASAAQAPKPVKTNDDPTGPTGSWLDDWWARLTANETDYRRAQWILLGLVTLISGVIRFVNLGHPGYLVFDETFYVKDAWSLVNLGYESKWPEDANEQWEKGNPNGYLDDPSYVVHPPLGKLIIGLGMMIFGAENPFAWRVAVAVFGTLLIPLVWVIAKRMTGSAPLATLAAGMVAIDGHAIVLSRISILDGILTFFVLLGFWFFLIDRDDQRRKLAAKLASWHAQHPTARIDHLEGYASLATDAAAAPTPAPYDATVRQRTAHTGPTWGPVVWNRPWLMAMALAFAAASAVKWSGLYFLAFFCVASLVTDMFVRRRYGVTFWASGAFLKQGPASFILTIPLAAIAYLITWTPWLMSDNGFYRHWAEDTNNAWEGPLAWVPLPLQNLWHYQVEAFRFHSNLTAEHPYATGPWTWPLLLRPTAFSYRYSTAGDGSGCQVESCVSAINSISNPLIWWMGTAAIVALLILMFRRPTWQAAAVLAGYLAGFLPWIITARTSVFHFYAIIMLPFMAIAITLIIQQLIGTKNSPRRERTRGLGFLFGWIGAISAISVFFAPIWYGILIPSSYWDLLQWLKGWR